LRQNVNKGLTTTIAKPNLQMLPENLSMTDHFKGKERTDVSIAACAHKKDDNKQNKEDNRQNKDDNK
jgi:hypothetical protein